MSGRKQASSSVLSLAIVGQDHQEWCSCERRPSDRLAVLVAAAPPRSRPASMEHSALMPGRIGAH